MVGARAALDRAGFSSTKRTWIAGQIDVLALVEARREARMSWQAYPWQSSAHWTPDD